MKHIASILTALAASVLPGSAAVVATFIYNGHGYAINDAALSWDDANAAATAMTGGSDGIPAGWGSAHLVKIESAGENTEILSQLLGAGISTTAADGGNATYAWIGAIEGTEGDYEWSDGEQFWTGGSGGSAVGGNYANWGSYTFFGNTTFEPDNFEGTQNRGAITTNGWPTGFPGTPANPGEWNDINHTNLLAYIVEFDLVPEPSSALLAALGSIGLLLRRRR